MSEISIRSLIEQCAEYLGQSMFPPAFAGAPPERATRQLLVDRFLELLGWSRDPSLHAKQVDEFGVAEVGRKWTDYALILDSRPYIFVEVKPLWEMKLERHSKQLIEDIKKFNRENPSRRTVYWGVLTNFREVQVYYYDDPKPFLTLNYEDYEKQWQLLEGLLSPAGIDNQELEKFYRENSKRPLDDEFLDDLKKWRLIIANGLYQLSSELTISELRIASQRLLDRLILIRILETSGVLPYEWLALRFRSWREGIIGLNKTFSEVLQEAFKEFESLYDTELFRHNEVDKHEMDDRFLRELVKVSGLPSPEVSRLVDESQQSFDDKGLYGYNFNLLTVDIMGSVYERYLAHSITIHKGRVVIERQDELRKKEGIYYTPPFVVNHIIENELTSLVTPVLTETLALLEQKRYKEAYRRIRSLANLKVLDPAFGSGSFLIRAFDVLYEAYDGYNKAAKEIWLSGNRGRLKVDGEGASLVEAPGERILLENLYGVDLDPQAVEIGKLNLWVHLLRTSGDSYRPVVGTATRKLLPDLELNLKHGNSIVGADFEMIDPLEYEYDEDSLHEKLREVLHLRDEIRKNILGLCPQFAKDDINMDKVEELLQRFRTLSSEIRIEANRALTSEFGEEYDQEYPIVWEMEFPEVFLDDKAFIRDDGGFQVIIGNPPYGADLSREQRKHLERHFTVASGYKNSAGIFIERCVELLAPMGHYGMIVPKSMTFSQQWADVRELLVDSVDLLRLVDVSKAFKGVLLEQVIFSVRNSERSSSHFTGYSMWDEDLPTVGVESTHMEIPIDLCREMDCLLIHVSSLSRDTYQKVRTKSTLMREVSDTSRGLPWQKYSGPANSGELVLRGADISRYCHREPKDRLDPVQVGGKSKEKEEKLKHQKILSQRIVAHVTKPHDRLVIMSSWDGDGILTLDTVENTWLKSDNIDPLWVVAFLNSRLISWIAYIFVFNKAIRTMDLDDYYLGKLPIGIPEGEEQERVKVLVKKLIAAHQQYRSLLDELPKDRTLDFFDLFREKEKWRISSLDTSLANFDEFRGVLIKEFDIEETEESLIIAHDTRQLAKLSIEDDDFRNYLTLMFEYWKHVRKNQEFKGNIELPSTFNLADEVKRILEEIDERVGTRHILQVRSDILRREEEINQKIYDYFELTSEERTLVESNAPTIGDII